MERILSVEQMKSADIYTIEKLGISEKTLIERAGTAVAEEIIKRLRGGRVLVCIGKGNNGEDGKVIASILSKVHGFTVATINISNGIFKMFDKHFDIIVDCIFGTGLNRNVEGKFKTAIEKINNSGAYIVSCDIPSGLNGNTGRVMGVAVKANLTIAIQEYKLGHFLNDGPDYSGEVIARDIGVSIWGDDYNQKMTNDDAIKYFPKLNRNINKGSLNKCSVIGGSKDYPGSVLLSYNALVSMKMGNGYSNIAFPECLYNVVCGVNPECTIKSLSCDGRHLIFDEQELKELVKYDALAFGMGVGITEENYKILSYLLNNYGGRLVIDADGLNTIARYGVEVLKNKKCDVIITPHIMEFSRLINKDKEEILTNSVCLAKEFAREYNVVVLLKNAVSVITDGTEVYLNTTGTSGMAKAGSGDVLSGIILGLSSRTEEAFSSAVLGAYLFGKAGEKCQKEQNDYTMTATDVIRELPNVINEL